jgi:hypothetical protein
MEKYSEECKNEENADQPNGADCPPVLACPNNDAKVTPFTPSEEKD